MSTLDYALPGLLSLTDCVILGRNPMCPPELEPPWKEIDMRFLPVGQRDLEAGRKFWARRMCRGHEAFVCTALVPASDSALLWWDGHPDGAKSEVVCRETTPSLLMASLHFYVTSR